MSTGPQSLQPELFPKSLPTPGLDERPYRPERHAGLRRRSRSSPGRGLQAAAALGGACARGGDGLRVRPQLRPESGHTHSCSSQHPCGTWTRHRGPWEKTGFSWVSCECPKRGHDLKWPLKDDTGLLCYSLPLKWTPVTTRPRGPVIDAPRSGWLGQC